MGRFVLLSLLLSACLAGCGDAGAPSDAGGASPGAARLATSRTAGRAGPHAELACASCHRGDLADRGVAAVPGAACAASGCHADAGPAEVTVAGVTLPHRNHTDEAGSVAMSCAGCHSHQEGSEPLSGSTDACGLCHAEQLSGENPADCRQCHRSPAHEGQTSQGLDVPHEGMPWIEGECVRCHYDVAEPKTGVSPGTCGACHTDLESITARSIGEDLHPGHTDVACHACHGESSHRIVAMSSAVSLECSQCHVQAHVVEVSPSFPGSVTCNRCHGGVHVEQQRLVLGVIPGFPNARPSEKFVDGLTCRSCHVPVAPTEQQATVTGSPVSCSGCHRSEYATVLRWWNRGTEERTRLVDDYLRSVEARLPADPPPGAVEAMGDAEALLALVRDAGAQHNLPLAHRLFEASVERAGEAARAAGQAAPRAPDLGRLPRMGLCTYCHYRLDDPWQFGDMPGDFHREVLQRR